MVFAHAVIRTIGLEESEGRWGRGMGFGVSSAVVRRLPKKTVLLKGGDRGRVVPARLGGVKMFAQVGGGGLLGCV